MGFFDRWFKRKPKVPAWAGFFSEAQLQRFLELVKLELKSWALDAVQHDDVMIGTNPEGAGREFLLPKVAHLCHQSGDEAAWREVIHTHFLTVFSVEDEARALLHRAEQFETVKDALRINVYTQKPAIVGEGRDVVSFEIADGLFGVVVLDFPTTTRSVSEAEMEPWGRTAEELIRVAVSNSVKEPVRKEQLALSDESSLTMIGGGFFTSSRVTSLDKFVPIDHPWGALVSVPNRNTLLLHPIATIKAVNSLHAMVLLSRRLHAAGPGGVSPEIYWWRQGVMTRVATRVEGESVQIAPSHEFSRMLTELSRPN